MKAKLQCTSAIFETDYRHIFQLPKQTAYTLVNTE